MDRVNSQEGCAKKDTVARDPLWCEESLSDICNEGSSQPTAEVRGVDAQPRPGSKRRREDETQESMKKCRRIEFPTSGYTRDILQTTLSLEDKLTLPSYIVRHEDLSPVDRDSFVGEILGGVWTTLTSLKERKVSMSSVYLGISILDRYLVRRSNVSKEELKEIGFAALFIALKYDAGPRSPLCQEVAQASGGITSPSLILQKEFKILQMLIEEGDGCGWKLEVPTMYTFLQLLLQNLDIVEDSSVGVFASSYLKKALQSYAMLRYPASMVATGAIHLAHKSEFDELEGNDFLTALTRSSGYATHELQQCEEDMAQL